MQVAKQKCLELGALPCLCSNEVLRQLPLQLNQGPRYPMRTLQQALLRQLCRGGYVCGATTPVRKAAVVPC